MPEEEPKPGAKRAKRGFFTYVKEAFLYHWNVLFFAGATAAAFLSGAPDVALPLVLAGEMVYLGGLSGHPKFRAVVDRKLAEADNPPDPKAQERAQESYASVLQSLPPPERERFQRVRSRCLTMRQLARGAQGRADLGARGDHQTPTLNRLLWVFLRLLRSQVALTEFLATTDGDAIRTHLESLRAREKAAGDNADERFVRSIRDSIATAELRLDNYEKAKLNAELVGLELDRIESKASALAEMAVSHEDPDYITNQVDSVNDSIQATENAMRDLSYLTGFSADSMQHAPSILEAEVES